MGNRLPVLLDRHKICIICEGNEEIMRHITSQNYQDMRVRVCNMEDGDSHIASTNFGRFIRFLEEDSIGWIEEINMKIEGEMTVRGIK